jgi:DNA-binding protein HU-beta
MRVYELSRRIADQTGLHIKEAKSVLDVLGGIVVDRLEKGDQVSLPGLGKFKTKMFKGRMIKSIKDGSDIKLEPYRKIRFVPEKKVDERLK